MNASFAKLEDGSWGVKIAANIGEATQYAGKTVTVVTKAGVHKEVELGSMLRQWNAGRAAIYARAQKAQESRPEMTAEEKQNLDIAVAELYRLKSEGRLKPGFMQGLLDQYEARGSLSPKQVECLLPFPGADVVPAGHYCITGKEGQSVFIHVWRNRTGERCACYLEHGPSESKLPVKRTLEAIVAYGPANAAVRYGREIKQCCVCNKRLTNLTSRLLGIGPVCGGRFFEDEEWYLAKGMAENRLIMAGFDPDANWDEMDEFAQNVYERFESEIFNAS